MINDPLLQPSFHSFCRAARGRCGSFEGPAAASSRGKRPPRSLFFGTHRGSRTRWRPAHPLASTSRPFSGVYHPEMVGAAHEHRETKAVPAQGHAAPVERASGGPRPARVGGPLIPFIYRFLRTFCDHVSSCPGASLKCAGEPVGHVGPVHLLYSDTHLWGCRWINGGLVA